MTKPQYIRWSNRREAAAQHLRDAIKEMRAACAVSEASEIRAHFGGVGEDCVTYAIGCAQGALDLLIIGDDVDGRRGVQVTALGTALAHSIIESELQRIPEADRGEVASQVLGALTGRFYFIPIPTVAEEEATRAALDAMDIPGLFMTSTKGSPQ